MPPSYDGALDGASAQDVARLLRRLAAGVGAPTASAPGGERPLELTPLDADPPRLEAAIPIEGGALAAQRVPGEPTVGFSAFLDGVQVSRVVGRWNDGVPIVHGIVAAVVRCRRDGELTTWRAPRVDRSVYLPASLAGDERVAALVDANIPVIDTLDGDAAHGARHPAELLAVARTAVQRRRELLETGLAESWVAHGDGPLYVDGGIASSGTASRSDAAVGIVKSHRTLYAAGDALGVVLALGEGERTSAFEIRSPRRTVVASWYLRLRGAAGMDPFFGLVRVEVARASFVPARADEVSRWVLAERAPVSLPDKRWSTMAYGIRNCEEYLRAITG
ncbi:MAG: hypothetical protein HY084_06665 [Gemmatimonadetes bacterium]|nr:hypothetical protein [Gemmatimonadota bacterium]